MPNKQDTIDIINNALQSDNKKVIVLKGDWGIGKTYLWKEIAEKNDKHSFFDICHKIHWLLSSEVRAKKEYKTGYVSLFGKKDFNEITQEAILSLYFKHKPRNIFEWLLIKTKSFWFKLFGVSNFQTITQSFSAVFALLGIYSLKNTIICFDDLERMDSNIDFKDFLGFVNDLAEHQECKVVLIFNEKELFNIKKVENTNDENDTEETDISDNLIIYNKFKEKTIDLEVAYTPTFEDNFNIACSIINHNLEDKYINNIKEVFEYINENNIRIMFKCIDNVNDFITSLETIKDNITRYNDFKNNILLKMIQSITYITQQYLKYGHKYWIQEESNNLKLNFAFKTDNTVVNTQSADIFFYHGLYEELIGAYLHGIPYQYNNSFISAFKNISIENSYNTLMNEISKISNNFWRTKTMTKKEYIHHITSLFSIDDYTYSFFIYYDDKEFDNFLTKYYLDNTSFEELFFSKMNDALDKFINTFDNEFKSINYYLYFNKIKYIDEKKLNKILYTPINLFEYHNLLNNLINDNAIEPSIYIIEHINMELYLQICEEDMDFFITARNLFITRKQDNLFKKIPHFLKIIAEDLMQSINDNPDNKFKYNILGKNNLNNPNYDIIKDINDYLEYYKNNYGDE